MAEYENTACALKVLRIAHDLTQHELAVAAHVATSKVGEWERGISEPMNGELKTLLEHFGIEDSNWQVAVDMTEDLLAQLR